MTAEQYKQAIIALLKGRRANYPAAGREPHGHVAGLLDAIRIIEETPSA